jgi:hypothetical protein
VVKVSTVEDLDLLIFVGQLDNFWVPDCCGTVFSRIMVLWKKELIADEGQGMVAVIQCRIFCLPVCYSKM